jgi:hypothetical protein
MIHNEIRAEIEEEITRLQQARMCLDGDTTKAQGALGVSEAIVANGSPVETKEHMRLSDAVKLRSAELKRATEAQWSLY